MDRIIARTERVWAQEGPALADLLQVQSLVALLTAGALFVLVTHLLAFTWKVRLSLGEKASLGVRFWSWFLFFPVLVLAVRLTSGEEWMAVLGQPNPLVASYAIFGLDAPAGGAFSPPPRGDLEDALAQSLSARAFQQIWPALLLSALALAALHREYRSGWPHTVVPPVALLALFLFGPIALDGDAWSAWFGEGHAFLERHMSHSPHDAPGDTP